MSKLRTLLIDLCDRGQENHIQLELCGGCAMSEAFEEAVRQMNRSAATPKTTNWTGNSSTTTGTMTFTPGNSNHTYGMAFDYYANTNDPNHFTVTNITIS